MKVVLLAGGVGGSRLADGMARLLGSDLTVVVNTGDDFDHYGLRICPDLDTVLYTLSGLGDPERGWGLAGETYNCLEALERLGEEPWFLLGDGDLATHLWRRQALDRGLRLTQVTDHLRRRLGVTCRVLPMADEPVATRVRTDEGWLSFQDYFVRHKHQPAVRELAFQGSPGLSPELEQALTEAELTVLAPSNPFVSLLPILRVSGLAERLPRPRLAVSPIVAGRALKGPAAAMLASLGFPVSAAGAALVLEGHLDELICDEQDRALELPCPARFLPTVMRNPEDRLELARRILEGWPESPG